MAAAHILRNLVQPPAGIVAVELTDGRRVFAPAGSHRSDEKAIARCPPPNFHLSESGKSARPIREEWMTKFTGNASGQEPLSFSSSGVPGAKTINADRRKPTAGSIGDKPR